MTNWEKIRQACSVLELAAILERELGDSVPTDWRDWLLEEAQG